MRLPYAIGFWLALLGPTVVSAVDAPAPPPAVTATNAPAKTRRLEEAELRDLLTSALNQKTGTGAEWELHLGRPWQPPTVPDEPLTVDIVEPAPNRLTSSCILRFELRAGRVLLGSWQMPVQAHLWRDVLVAEDKLSRGQVLADVNLTHERRDVLTLREPLLELPAHPDAYQLAEGVAPGSPLLSRAIRLKPVVFRGQTAEAVVSDGAMVIAVKVEVMEEGVPGQLVRVRNLQTRREIRGKVQDERTIQVML